MAWWSGLVRLLLAVSVVLLPLACDGGSSASGDPNVDQPDDSAVAGHTDSGCVSNLPCTCTDGSSGRTACVVGSPAACVCGPSFGAAGTSGAAGGTNCTSFSAAEVPTLRACGGEPFGVWQATKFELGPSLAVLDPLLDPYQHSSGCPVLPSKADTPTFLLDLESGGVASFALGAWSFDYEWDSGCNDAVCSSSDAPRTGDCVCGPDNGCGVSSCTLHTTGNAYDRGSWTRSGSSITLRGTGSGFVDNKLDYCVQGDTMQITWGSALITLKRVQVGGVPAACAERGAKDCTLGNGVLSVGCHAACVGGDACTDAQSETQCTNRQGCSWDTTQCAGNADSSCSIEDYGVVPGCEVLSTSAQCVGTPEPCFGTGDDQKSCEATPGCQYGEACIGGTLKCSDAFDCGSCNGIPGCTCNQDGSCEGSASFDCTANDGQSHCISWGKNLDLCSWSYETCHGTPTACSDLPIADCTATAGCQLQAQ